METYAAIVSALVAAIGLFTSWLKVREAALRREDVLNWSNEVIESLTTLWLLCTLEEAILAPESRRAKLEKVTVATSILVEKGRLLFKNRTNNNYGRKKIRAYQGYRPLILDKIVIAHQIAVHWTNAEPEKRLRLQLVAEDCLRHFVSLAQLEVGRSRTADTRTNEPGRGDALGDHLQALDQKRVERAGNLKSG